MQWQARLGLLAACALAAGCSSSQRSNTDGGGADVVEAAPETPDALPEVDSDDAPAGVDAADASDAADDAPDGGADEVGACRRWTGDRQFGTTREDTVLALAVSPTGIVAGGYVGGTLNATNIEPSGDARGFVRALSLTGDTLWETPLDATGTETIEALAADAAGAVVAAGRTTGAFPGFTNLGQQDAFVAWLSPAGVLGPVRQLGDERPQHPRRIVLTPTGVALGGFDDGYVPTNYVVDWENPFFATVDAPPATTSASHPDRTPGPDFAEGFALDPLGTGDFFLAGVVTSGTQKGLFVRRVGADGAQRWSTRLTTIGLEIPGPLVALPDGTLWIAAAWLRTTGTSDVSLIHVDAATGALIRSVDFPTADGSEEVAALTRDARGDFWVAGSVSGLAFRGATSAGEIDAFVYHLAPDGAFIDAWQDGTPAQEYARALAIDACGNVVVGGSTDGAFIPGATPLGGTDAFVRRVPLEVRR